MSVVGPLFGFSMLAFEVFKRRLTEAQGAASSRAAAQSEIR